MTGARESGLEQLEQLRAGPRAARQAWLQDEQVALADLQRFAEAVELLAMSDAGAAVETGQALVELADDLGRAEPRARARRAGAQALAYTGRLPEALALAEAGAGLAETGGCAVEAARCRLASIHPLAALGRYDEAAAAGELARLALLHAGEPALAARADLNLGAVAAMRDDPRGALRHFDRARPGLVDEPAVLAQLDTNRGNALAAIGDHAGAQAAFASALAAFENDGQELAAAIAEGNLGHLAARRGDIQPALRHFERARRRLERVESPAHRARLLAEHAAVIASLGLPAEALASLSELIPQLREMGLTAEVARARLAAGRAAIALELPDVASEHLERAAEALSETGQPSLLAEADLLRAGLHLQADDALAARETATAAYDLVGDRPLDRGLAAALLARIAIARGELVEATEWLERAETDAAQLRIAPITAELHLLAGLVARGRGLPAVAQFAAAVAETERVRSTLQAVRLRAAFHAVRLAPYIELLIETLAESSDPARDFAVAELLKSRSLLETRAPGRVRHAGREFDPLYRELESRRSELNWTYSQLERGPAWVDQIAALERQVAELEGRVGALASRPPGISQPASAGEVHQRLGATSVAISYVIAHDELLAFTLRDGRVSVNRRLAGLPELTDAIRRVRLQIGRARALTASSQRAARLLIDVQRELFRLWSMLFAPLASDIADADRLVIAPSGPLHAVPFAALWDGRHYLVERAEIVAVPSLSLFARLQGDELPSPRSAFIAGVADELIPHVPEEIARVQEMLPAATVLSGAEATVEAVASGMAGTSPIHLACHGRYLRELPGASGLKLTGGWLTPSRIAELPLAGAHVTLSACDTGRVSVQAGDEIIGLARAFYAAGVGSLITSLWPVHDESTTELMSTLYRRRRDVSTFGAALRAAQTGAIARGEHPARWAAFVYGGR